MQVLGGWQPLTFSLLLRSCLKDAPVTRRGGPCRPHAALMLHAAKRALAGCSDASWQAAAAAATAVVGCLSGSGPYSQANHEVMTSERALPGQPLHAPEHRRPAHMLEEGSSHVLAPHRRMSSACLPLTPPPPATAVLLDEGELGAHKAERAVAWLASALPLFPRLGLQLAAHFGRLMPLLLGWCLAPQHAVRVAALGALLQAVQLTWPRVGAHAAPVWGVLRRARADALQRRWANRLSPCACYGRFCWGHLCSGPSCLPLG